MMIMSMWFSYWIGCASGLVIGMFLYSVLGANKDG